VNVFAPLSVSDPNPAFVSENAPPNTPLITTPLAVVTVVFAASVPEPLNVRTPFFTASPNVTVPPIDTAFAIVRAVVPSLDTTDPAKVTVPVPNAPSFPTYTGPAFNTAPPTNVFAPLNVNAPLPAFVKTLDPLKIPLKTTPLATVNVVSAVNVPSPPNVNTPLFTASPNVAAPPIDTAFVIVRAVVPSLDTTPPLNVKTPVPNPASFPTNTEPDDTVTPPVKVFTPPNVNELAPSFDNENPPPTTPLNTTPLNVVKVVAETNVPVPESVNVPLFTASPNVTEPPNVYAFPNVRAVVPSLETIPPPNVNGPVPNAPTLPTNTEPAFTDAPPVNVFAPLNVSVPLPLFTNAPPVPLITPEYVDTPLPPTVNVFP
jgi:hypothetical protein